MIKQKVPAYVERAMLWLMDGYDRAEAVYRLMPHASGEVGRRLANAENAALNRSAERKLRREIMAKLKRTKI
jgi:hypothetical protein